MNHKLYAVDFGTPEETFIRITQIIARERGVPLSAFHHLFQEDYGRSSLRLTEWWAD